MTMVQLYQISMKSNPVYGRNPDAGPELNWIYTSGALDKTTEEMRHIEVNNRLEFTQRYFNSLGPIEVPTRITKMALYIADKKTCLSAYGNDQPKGIQ